MFARILSVILLIMFSSSVVAETPDPKMQLLFIGADPSNGAPGDIPVSLPIIAVDALPHAEDAQQTVFAARLRASPVSTFVANPTEGNAQFEQFFLVMDVELSRKEPGYALSISDEAFPLDDFATRVSALVGAFKPRSRRIGFIQITDPEDIFPTAIGDVQSALSGIGFDMLVLMIGAGDGVACQMPDALHYSLVSGLADRAPFGNGDGVSSADEVEEFLNSALNRRTLRDPLCGPKYSVLMKAANDPDQELVAYSGRAFFAQMESTLYNETFEARFLLNSEEQSNVEEFLASCQYCPNETALTDRLREMEEFSRTSALEAEIWDKIKKDESSERLAIYLENCALCTYRSEVESRIAELDAKAAAYDGEALAYKTAVAERDVVALRNYVEDCIACAFQEEARIIVSDIESDVAYQRETAAYSAAMEARDITLLSAFLEDCQICEGKADVASALKIETKRVELVEPCLAMAAVPQLGGPRKLTAIDQAKSRATCEAAIDAFPEDKTIATTLGRIAQAAGDYEAARAAYGTGMSADLPSAYGLAAYTYYAPPEGSEIDLAEAEKLAILGADKGDWLSQEILTVLYSKGLVPGRTPAEAFKIAEVIAKEGNEMAEYFVGYYYLTGTGVSLDLSKAEAWLKKSVDQGYTNAMPFLAEVYEAGPADEPQHAKAAELYWTAMNLGDETAIERLTTQLFSRDREVIRVIQERLQEEGAYRGAVDGLAGPGTVTAIRDYADTILAGG